MNNGPSIAAVAHHPRAPVGAASIPLELRERDQWVCWQWKRRNGRWTKPPIGARTGVEIDVADSVAWTSFEAALASCERLKLAGIGFAFSIDDPYAGVDLDDCIDQSTGLVSSWAQVILDDFDTYAEQSPSGTGIKLICKGTLPTTKTGTRRRYESGMVEMYHCGRYFTITGQIWPGAPLSVNQCDEQLARLWERIRSRGNDESQKTRRPAALPPQSFVGGDDDEVVRRATAAKNGAKFEQLWAGKIDGFPSQSEADLALCSRLAFWCGPNPDRIDTLFRQSGLMRDKWEREDYRTETIEKAIERCDAFFDWSRRRGRMRSTRGSANHNGQSNGELSRALPRIDAGCKDLSIVTGEAWDAIQKANEPEKIFRYGGLPARIETGDLGDPVIRLLDQDRTRHHLARCAIWYTVEKIGKNEAEKIVAPPRDVVRDVLATPDMPLPPLSRVTEAPTFAPDGSLAATPGYHHAAQVYYAPAAGFCVPPVSQVPSDQEIADARALICEDLLGDFPFVGDSELAHAVALYILPFVRDLIDGPTPLHLIEKSTPGTGATLLADALTYPAIGRPLAAMTEGRDEDEWRKRIFAKLRGGASYVVIDNLRRRLDSGAVSSAITALFLDDRILGVSENAIIPVRCCWIATGNNPALSNEIARRTIRIRLDAKTDRPWLRPEGDFRHPNLREYLKENRGRLVWAALTLVRAWLAAGRPEGTKSLGMFESWSKTIGGIFQTVGVPGFLANLDSFYEDSDTESAAWRTFLAGWWSEYRTAETPVKDLWKIACDDAGISLGDGSDQSQKVVLGKLLVEKRDRIYSIEIDGQPTRLRIAKGGTYKRATLWRLEQIHQTHHGELPPGECVSLVSQSDPNAYACARARTPEDGSEILTETHQTHQDVDVDEFDTWN